MFIKRGSSVRGPFEGGKIEREKAAYFEELQKKMKNKFPNVSEIFRGMKERYLIDAKQNDEEAERNKLEY